MTARALFSRLEAAEFCGVSLATFTRRVQPALPYVPVGGRVLFDVEDLRRWVDMQKVGSSSIAQAGTTSDSVTGACASPSPAARAILARLRRKPRESTPTRRAGGAER